jgi:uncharacterized protein (DUF488 family)
MMPTIYTVGHSTRTLDELLEMLGAHGVTGIADVRRFAGSRRLPHFNADSLAAELPNRGFGYLPCPLLGGRRKAAPDSTNTGWRNASFEAVPWRCHRSLIADALIVRGWTVLDVMSRTKASVHKLTPFAHVRGTAITYPAAPEPPVE